MAAENSKVFPMERSRFVERAVAVIVCPTGTLAAGEKVKVTLPEDAVKPKFVEFIIHALQCIRVVATPFLSMPSGSRLPVRWRTRGPKAT